MARSLPLGRGALRGFLRASAPGSAGLERERSFACAFYLETLPFAFDAAFAGAFFTLAFGFAAGLADTFGRSLGDTLDANLTVFFGGAFFTGRGGSGAGAPGTGPETGDIP